MKTYTQWTLEYSKKAKLKRSIAEDAIKAFMEYIIEELNTEGRAKTPLGVFSSKYNPPRKMRNFLTGKGEEMTTKGSYKFGMRASRELKSQLRMDIKE